jgi:hypothetical protein
MSNPRRPVRGKPERSKAQNGLALSGKPAKSKTQDTGKTAPKPTTVAAEIGAPATRKEPASVPPTPVQRPSAPAAAKPAAAAPAANPAPVAAKRAPVTVKPAPVAAKPAPVAAKPVPVAAKATAAPRKAAAAEAAELPQHLLGSAVETIERSVNAAGQGSVAVNCKLLDFARANVMSGLDHVRDLATARTPLRVMRLQMEYWHDCLETLAKQAQELRALQADLIAGASEPLRRQIRGALPKD